MIYLWHRIVAQNSAGTSYGRERSIYSITPQFLSGVVTYDATDVTPNSAVLHGEITTVPNNIWFEFDTVEGEYFYTANANGLILTTRNPHGTVPATTHYYRMAASDKLYAYYGETKFLPHRRQPIHHLLPYIPPFRNKYNIKLSNFERIGLPSPHSKDNGIF